MQSVVKRKFNNLSCYRMVAAISILIFHVFFCLGNHTMTTNLFSKGVQGLTLLSGFLYSSKVIDSTKGFYKKNIMKLLTPVIWILLLTLVTTSIMWAINPNQSLISYWFGTSKGQSRLFIYGNFWYIPMILICYLMTPILYKAKTTKNPYYILIISLAILFELMLGGNNLYFPISFTFYVFGYFYGGLDDIYNKITDDKFYVKDLLLSLALFTIFILLYYYSYLFFEGNVMNFFVNFFSSCIGGASFFLLAYLFKPLNRMNRLSSFFKVTDKMSYPFYLLNQIFSTGAFAIYVCDSLALSGFLIFIATSVSALIISYLDSSFRSLIARHKANKVVVEGL